MSRVVLSQCLAEFADSCPEDSMRVAAELVFPLADVLPLAAEAGKVIMEYYSGRAGEVAVERKDDNSPVTIADRASHEVLVRGLARLYPDVPVLSEEGDMPTDAERAGWNSYFLVDPMDGTKGFIRRTDNFTVNVALMRRNAEDVPEPVAGVIYVPVSGVWYWGGEAYGSYRQDAPDTPAVRLATKSWEAPDSSAADEVPRIEGAANSASTDNAGSPAGFEKTDSPEGKNISEDSEALCDASHISEAACGPVVLQSDVDKTPRLSAWLGEMVHTRLRAGSSLKFCLLAEGTAQLFPCLHPTWEWDTAAGHAIVLGAGGSMTTIDGEPFVYGKNPPLNGYFLAKG